MAYYDYVKDYDDFDDWEDFDDCSYCDCCKPKIRRRKFKKICCVKICNKIEIEQKAEANGGDGGNGGDNNSAAAAAAAGEGILVPVACAKTEQPDWVDPCDVLEETEEKPTSEATEGSETESNTATATAEAGNGGNGGNGGNIAQVATIANWTVVICGDAKHEDLVDGLKLDSDGKKVNVKMDNGEIFINGEKMEAKEMEDGTKVFIVKQ